MDKSREPGRRPPVGVVGAGWRRAQGIVSWAAPAAALLAASVAGVVSAGEVEARVLKGFSATGAVTPAVYRLYGVNDRREWQVRLTLTNATPYGVELGTDMVLVESDETGSTFLGVYHSRGRSKPAGTSTTASRCEEAARYGVVDFEQQWADGTSQGYSDGGTFTFRDADSPQRDPEKLSFGRLAAGANLVFEADLLQGRWLRFEHATSLRVVLPELEVKAAGASHRFRAVASFAKPQGADEPWPLSRLEIVPLEPASLLEVLLTPEENVVRRVFAANWLRDVDPAAAAAGAARVARTLAAGDLLAVCFNIVLAGSSEADPELVSHSRNLLAGDGTPEGIRTLARRYLVHVGVAAAQEAPPAPGSRSAPTAAPTRSAPPTATAVPPAPPTATPPPASDVRRRLQEHYVAYLRSEGYLPEIDSDGDVHFKREGYSYYLIIDADDPEYFRILLPNIWRIAGDADRTKVLAACDRATRTTKVAKVYTANDQVSIAVELLLPETEDVAAVFPRAMRILASALATFTESMRD